MAAKTRKGIILAGGAGTRLHPITMSLSNQLLPVYDKPMIYYPLAHAAAAVFGESLLGGAPSALILGDNIFYGANVTELLMSAAQRESGATVFGYYVKDPERYGVVQLA